MAVFNKVTKTKTFMGKLAHGADLLEELVSICKDNNVGLGRVEAIGAVQKAKIGYYNQDKRQYNFLDIDKHLEITSLVGNISLKDGDPIIHAHITLGDSGGKAFGGHLAPGNIVFACEFVMEAFDGPKLSRGLDEQTGLPLWEM